MKRRLKPYLRRIAALLLATVMPLMAGCSLLDPVVSVGSPSPMITQNATPERAVQTAAPKPSATPQSSAASPTQMPEETNGAGAYTIAADISESKKTYYSTKPDENALRVENGAIAGLDGATVEKRAGDAGSIENTTEFGLNAAVLVHGGAQLLMVNSDVTAAALGAGGVFACAGKAQMQSSVVRATGDSAYALSSSHGGSIRAMETDLSTLGTASPAIIALRDSSIHMEGGKAATAGTDSPIIRASGRVSIDGATMRANSAEAVACNAGSVSLTDCAVSGRMSDAAAGTQSAPYCVSLYRDRDSAQQDEQSSFSMIRGALSAIRGDLFYVTNTQADIYLEGVALTLGEGRAFLHVSGNDGSRGWGEAGKNGADCTLNAKDQTIAGDIVVDELSTVAIVLRGESAYTGTVNTSNTARAAKVTLEDEATWTLTDNAYLTAFTGRVGSIITNGFTVFVNGVALT